MACDFFSVDAAFPKRLSVFAIMDTITRQIVAVAVTNNPTADWLETVIRNVFMDVEEHPTFMVSDRDSMYCGWFRKFLSACYGITRYRTSLRTPNCIAFIERWNRTFLEDASLVSTGTPMIGQSTGEFNSVYDV
jgi:transposase InsO family protein